MRVVLLGLPGSGKGTEGSLLSRHYGVPHIATGAMIRDNIARGTEFGRKVQAAIDGGNFAPDTDIFEWIYRRLAKSDAMDGYILDGFPRDLAQGADFARHNDEIGQRLDAVVELVIDEDELIGRLSGRLSCPVCGEPYHTTGRPPKIAGICDRDGAILVRRPDDEPEAIRHRFELYRTVTHPLREFYLSRGELAPVDASGGAEVVFDRIRKLLDDRISGAAG